VAGSLQIVSPGVPKRGSYCLFRTDDCSVTFICSFLAHNDVHAAGIDAVTYLTGAPDVTGEVRRMDSAYRQRVVTLDAFSLSGCVFGERPVLPDFRRPPCCTTGAHGPAYDRRSEACIPGTGGRGVRSTALNWLVFFAVGKSSYGPNHDLRLNRRMPCLQALEEAASRELLSTSAYRRFRMKGSASFGVSLIR